MTALRIPTSTDPKLGHYDERVRLEGQDYILGFDWNERDASWYLTLSTADGTVLARSIKIVLEYPLLRRLVDKRVPPGELVAKDLTGRRLKPGLNDFGSRVVLFYYPAEDLP